MKKSISTKNKIYNESIKLFKEKGYDNVTISEITKSCKVSKGSFYTYFESKSDILVNQFKIIDEKYLEYYKNNNLQTIDGLSQFLKYAFCVVEKYVGKEMLRNLYIKDLLDEHFNYLKSEERPLYIVLNGILAGEEFKNMNHHAILQLCITMIRGLCFEWATIKTDEPISHYTNEIIDVVVGTLKNEK